MLKRGLALLLALVMLASVSVAGAAWSEGDHKYVSVADWSKADIEKAIKLNLDVAYTGENVQMSIARVDFAEDAAALVGLAYGQDIRTYERYNELQVLLNKAKKKDVWREMGILKGRGNGYYVDPNTPITRQEAAVVLARVYKDVILDTGPVSGKVYKNSENRRKQGVSCGFRCSCRYSISLTSGHPGCGCSRCRSP